MEAERWNESLLFSADEQETIDKENGQTLTKEQKMMRLDETSAKL